MTSPDCAYRFALELHRGDERGSLDKIATLPVEVDWQPALECARFEQIRHNPDELPVLDISGGSIVPSWDEAMQQPYIDGVNVRFGDDPGQGPGMLIPTEFFRSHARQCASQLVEQGKLEQGETYRYRVCAYSQPSGTSPGSGSLKNDLTVESVLEPLELIERDFAPRATQTVPYGPQVEDEIPVIVPRRVVDEAVRLTQSAGAAETGGVLLGHLHRDPTTSAIYARVTSQVPARRAEQSLTKLTFTPQVWADVDAALRLRNKNEMYLGWWHSHPARQWCKDCPVENRKRCKLSGEFFSSDDAALHQCVFPRAYSVALVISDSYATGLTWPLFGWNRGVVAERGYLIDEGASISPSATTTAVNR